MRLPSFVWLLLKPILKDRHEEVKRKRIAKKRRYHEQRMRQKRALFLAYVLKSISDENEGRFRDSLTMEGVWRRDRRIPRCALLMPNQPPWERLYQSGNDQAMITVTGYDHSSFPGLLRLFEPYFNNFTPWTGNKDGNTYAELKHASNRRTTGRPRLVKPAS